MPIKIVLSAVFAVFRYTELTTMVGVNVEMGKNSVTLS